MTSVVTLINTREGRYIYSRQLFMTLFAGGDQLHAWTWTIAKTVFPSMRPHQKQDIDMFIEDSSNQFLAWAWTVTMMEFSQGACVRGLW